MIVIPSLDVRDGSCFLEGETVPTSPFVRNDAGDLLRSLIRFGFSRFHVTDLEPRAHRRSALNLTAEWFSEHSVQFQVSSNVKRRDQIDDLLSAGASFVVVGPAGVDNEDWLTELGGDDSRTLIVAVDVNARCIQAPSARVGMPRKAIDWVEEFSHLALGAVLVRAVDEQGQRAPCDFALLEDLVETAAFPILAAGVLGTLGELDALQDRGVAGALLGECLHTGRIDPWIAAEFSA